MLKRCLLIATVAIVSSVVRAEEFVIEDRGVGITARELEYLVKFWPEAMKRAAVDPGDRIELINMALANKKIALEADNVTEESQPELYWSHQFRLRNVNRKFVVNNYMSSLEIPDMTALARERYLTEKDKYARVPEQRLTSHILIRCQPPGCARDDKRPEIEAVWTELQAGASFDDLVAKYSEDPGSKAIGGRFDRWLTPGMPRVDRYYIEAAFAIEAEGQYSGVVESHAGFHIIRLDELKEEHYKPFEEVEATIVEDLTTEYKRLAAKEFDGRYRLTGEAYLNHEAIDQIIRKYIPADALEQFR